MLDLKIYGTGCAKCQRLEAEARSAAEAAGVPFTLEKVMDRDAIIDAGIMLTPALAVNGAVKAAGRVPSREQLVELMKACA